MQIKQIRKLLTSLRLSAKLVLTGIESIRDRFELADSEGLRVLTDRFGELRKRMDAAPRTLAYNDFYYTNLAVKKDASEALMFDYNLL